ncbi:MAG: serine protease, partial [SAR324 cluster bacterium]|nr:serine protease [SAR324 cluster bacterium]
MITVIPFHANADLLNSAVRIKAQIPEKARTSKFLGKEREGSGIVIDDEGHVLTIGYLVLEAGSVEITDVDGRVIAAAVEGYDGDSGFGLLKALSPLQARPLRLRDSSDIQSEERLRVVSSQDDTVVQQVVVLERGTFAGYWEYLLENAIFT